MEVLLLGPLEVRDRGRALSVHGNRPRALLALLALNAGRVMSAGRLIELLWGDEAPPSAANALQVHVAALRKVLEPRGQPYRTLASDGAGYVLKLNPEQLDYAQFEQLVDQGHMALKRGDVALSAELLGQATNLWRGSALANLADQPWSIGEARRLEELRLAATEDRIEAELALGRHAELIAELEALVPTHPLRERLRGQLMLALYRSGRQAEASIVYQKTRDVLIEELGMEPGLDLQRLLKAILNQEPSLGIPGPERPPLRLDNLPTALTSFVNRTQEMTELALLLPETRLLTLTGPGGIGKTRLAIEVARGLVARYERGIWLTSFASLADPDLVPQAVGTALLVRSAGGQAPTEALINYLRDRQSLLLFDNCEHLIDACAKLAEALITSCPRVTILATSREALGIPGEVVWPVPPLEVPQVGRDSLGVSPQEYGAVELFRQRAESATGSFRLDEGGRQTSIQVCRDLDGIPLAIELAAARLKIISLDDLSARLKNRFELLTGGSRTALPRHQTLRATIDWSYDLLSESEASLLQKLSVFSGSFTLQAAEAVCGERPGDVNGVLEILSSLVRKSMVQLQRGDLEIRYQLLDTMRQYAYEKFVETAPVSAVRQRHEELYLDLAERAAPHLRGPSATVWISRLARDHDNIRAAVQRSVDERDGDRLARFLVAMWWFWYVRCFFAEGRRWLETALANLQPASVSTHVALLLGSGQLAWAQGDHQTDQRMFKTALALATDAGDELLIGHALLRMSLADYAAGRMRLAENHLEGSIQLLRKHAQASLLAEALNNLGWIRAFELNDSRSAQPLLEESLSIARQCGDQWTLQEVLDSVANLKLLHGDIDDAEPLQVESLRICSALGDAWSLPRILVGFVRLALARDKPARALVLSSAAEKLRDDVGMVLMSAEQAQLDPLVQAALAQLTPELAESAWQSGTRMAIDDVVKYALSQELGVQTALSTP